MEDRPREARRVYVYLGYGPLYIYPFLFTNKKKTHQERKINKRKIKLTGRIRSNSAPPEYSAWEAKKTNKALFREAKSSF